MAEPAEPNAPATRPGGPGRPADSGAGGGATLVFNAGSSSLKYELLDPDERTLLRGALNRIGSGDEVHELALGGRATRTAGTSCPDYEAAVRQALDDVVGALGGDWTGRVGAAGHRVVHGGRHYWRPTVIDDAVLAVLREQVELAPLHNGPSTLAIGAARALLPSIPHVAVFDTGFHHDLPPVAQAYALPVEIGERWAIRRYGFHGISCQYLVRRVAELGIRPAGRLLLCHLGAGASVTAARDGRSCDTSMGFTPLEGLVMATRSGDLDPGVLLYLLRHAGLDADALEGLLERESGLRGLSGRTGDYATLATRAGEGDARAALALEVFAYRVRKYLGAYWAALGGADAVVFAGGIGENSASARAGILAPMAGLGWRLDAAANEAGPAERRVSPPGASPELWVIPTRETLAIAREVKSLLDPAPPPAPPAPRA
jgi:acetate kinase